MVTVLNKTVFSAVIAFFETVFFESLANPLLYRVDGPIRNSLFLIWAKGECGVSPSRTPIFKKLSGNEKAISGSGPVSER